MRHIFSRDWWYAEGNIIKFEQYERLGFYIVHQRNLKLCDEDGQIQLIGKVLPLPEYPKGFLWRNVNHGVHSRLDSWNEDQKKEYLLFTDAMYRQRKIEQEEAHKQQQLKWAAHAKQIKEDGPLAEEMDYFDWTWQEADQFYPGKHEQRNEIFAKLEALSYEQAKYLWDNYGPKGYRGAGHPDWTKCDGFKFPARYISNFKIPNDSDSTEIVNYFYINANGIWKSIELAKISPRGFRIAGDYANLYKALLSNQIPHDTPFIEKGEVWITVGKRLSEVKASPTYAYLFK